MMVMGILVRPQQRFFAAKALAGAILLDPTTYHALLVNTIEVYGRSSLADAHHERTLSKRGIAAPSTNPPMNSRYKDIWVVSLQENDGYKLNVGTKASNGLITSSVRLDKELKPELGPTTSKFVVKEQCGRDIQIFLDVECYEAVIKLAKDEDATCIQNVDLLQRLRQVRSKFHEHSTFIPSRASSPLCNFHRTQPQSVFTYCTFDNGHVDTDGRLASQVFAQLAIQVIRYSGRATLEKAKLVRILQQCHPEGSVAKFVAKMISVYPDECPSMVILGNKVLNPLLTNLAGLLSTYIASANITIASDIDCVLAKACSSNSIPPLLPFVHTPFWPILYPL